MQDISIELERLSEDMLRDSAEIIAATAQEYYRDSFRRKGFDGEAWQPTRHAHRRGSLLVKSGALANSIRIVEVSPQRVVIAAGGDKVGYAQAHNEGFRGKVAVPEHQRRLKPRPLVQQAETKPRKKEVVVHAHTRAMNLPQRQFMGEARELNELIRNRLLGYLASRTNQ